MVVMEDGLPKRSDYRRFKIRHQPGQDDFAAMEEALTRRFRRYLAERDDGARTGKRFAYPPNLLLVDGGKGQLGVAVRVLEDLGLEDICVASLAKRFEEVYLPARPEPVRIPRDSEALYLLQQVRDEAHRFAITYHRQLRDKKMTKSVLDDVPGLGPTRRAPPAQGARFGQAPARAGRGRPRGDPVAPRDGRRARCTRQLHGDLRPSERDHDPRRHRRHGHVRGGALGGRRRARGPRLLRHRQPAARAHHEGRRARGRQGPGTSGSRWSSTSASGEFVDELDAALAELRAHGREHAGPVPRRRRRRARPPLRGDPAEASARRRRARVRGHRRRACAARGPQGRRRPRGRHLGPQRARAARPPPRARSATPTRWPAALQTSVVSFGYKHGLPIDVDLVFDCRFLPNPHWVEELRPLPGTDPTVRDYVLEPARDRRRSSTSSSGCSRCSCRRTCARARRTCRSASAAPAVVTAAS